MKKVIFRSEFLKSILYYMRKLFLLLFALLPLILLAQFQYPATKKTDSADNYFGTVVADPYRWLEDDKSDETKAWVQAENKVTSGYFDKIPFRDKIKKRL